MKTLTASVIVLAIILALSFSTIAIAEDTISTAATSEAETVESIPQPSVNPAPKEKEGLSETLLAVIITGLVTLVPNTIREILTSRNADKQRKHEIKRFRVNMVFEKRIAAFEELCSVMSSRFHATMDDDNSERVSAYSYELNIACLKLKPFVTQSTALKIESLVRIVNDYILTQPEILLWGSWDEEINARIDNAIDDLRVEIMLESEG